MATEVFLVLLSLTNLYLLGLSRLGACIQATAIQGLLLGLLTVVEADVLSIHALALAIGSTALKAIVFPRLLFRALREAEVRHEVDPYVGFNLSILAGVLALGASLWLGHRLPLPVGVTTPLVVPAALFTLLTGLFLIVCRKNALNQVVGYLVLENGIYVFGVTIVNDQPLLVELGVLLDVFVAVFVMGITMFQINRTFDHIDTHKLSTLKD